MSLYKSGGGAIRLLAVIGAALAAMLTSAAAQQGERGLLASDLLVPLRGLMNPEAAPC